MASRVTAKVMFSAEGLFGHQSVNIHQKRSILRTFFPNLSKSITYSCIVPSSVDPIRPKTKALRRRQPDGRELRLLCAPRDEEPSIKIHQRGVQWKQGVVVRIML